MAIRALVRRGIDGALARVASFAEGVVDRIAPPITQEVVVQESEGSGDLLQSRDEVLQAHGQGDLSLYERLLSDDQVHATFSQRRTEIICREWFVEPGGPNPIDKLAADDLREQMKRLGWDRVCYKMLGGEWYGNGYGEPMFVVDDTGHVQMTQIKVRRPHRFAFAKDGSLRLKGKSGHTAIPDNKIWVFRAGAETDDDPHGLALAAPVYWPVWFKRNGMRFWATFIERFANPTPKATTPPGTTEKERNDLIAMLGKIMNGGRIVVPRGVDVELIQAIRSSGGDFQAFVELMNACISKVVLLQTMTTDQGSSYAQANVHYKVGTARAKSGSDLLDESFMRGPATWLTQWNYPGAATPNVYRDFTEAQDLKSVAERDTALNNMGYRPKPDYVKRVYGDNYEFKEPPPPPTGNPLAFAEPLPRDPVSGLVDDQGWRRVLGPQVEAIEAKLGECETLEQFRDQLGELALDHPHQMTEALSRVLFSARVAGNAEAEDADDGAA